MSSATVCNKINNFLSTVDYKNSIYLDNQSTTPVDPLVVSEMIKVLTQDYGNPHSRSHIFGWRAEEIVENARLKVANIINANSNDIIFTSGATESNNLAIKGIARFAKTDKKNHLITLKTEHKCVMESFRALQSEGFEVTFLSPKEDGILDLDDLKNSIKDNTILVSTMGINNEIGVIQDLKAIGNLIKEINPSILFHTDCAQTVGKVPLDVEDMKIDAMSISAHKIYGPKGIGGLYVRRKPKVKLKPLFSGGGQERGLRSGTVAPFLAHGFGIAVDLLQQNMQEEISRIESFGKQIWQKLSALDSVKLNGSATQRYWGNVNISFNFVEGESLMMAMKNIAVSSGSACTSASLEPSYVLRAIGLPDELAHSSIRFGIGRFNTQQDIDTTIEVVSAGVQKLRDLSPLWEMHCNGIDINSIKWKSH